ncbi:MAG: peptide MFS transporter [Acidobacteria bacterium]|nr:peptide MFS transporter [Acidobacteriota bacterium]
MAKVAERHPKGLYVLFATEMWERFSFYSMVALFTLYLRDPVEGFGWDAADATTLYANYSMFVYLSPLVGGYIADKFIGYRRAVMIGGFFFMAGHLLLSFRSLPIVYAALACLVIGNGFFKPNVSTMVGNLYPEGSHLKDRAYNIFYMGINVGATAAPLVAEVVKRVYGVHVAFAVAAFGMLISVWILGQFRRYVEAPKPEVADTGSQIDMDRAVAGLDQRVHTPAPAMAIDLVPDRRRIGALIVIYLVVIIFWMVFHQNASTMTYWAEENTAWDFSGTISNAINPAWVILLTFPLVAFWKWLDSKGKEPSTPTKMVFGMVFTGVAFFILFIAARTGEATVTGDNPYAFEVSPLWLVGAYGVLTLGELMLSPMGLSLVSKVAPISKRGLMMGGWFVATAIGNKLTQIGVLWTYWLHSSFWLMLSAAALFMAVVLFFLLKPLKKAMPGV